MDRQRQQKAALLQRTIKHIDITAHDTRALIDAFQEMSFSARELGRACEIYERMLQDPDCTIILTVAGSTSAAGCMQVYVDLVRHNMVDAIVATGATVIDMDFFEALGFAHYRGTQYVDDAMLREHYIDRIYDTFIDEDELQHCDRTIKEIADGLARRPYSSREFIEEMGRWLVAHPGRAAKPNSLVQTAYEHGVPIFCPAFSDSSAGFGLVAHQVERPDAHLTIDSVRDFRELTELKIAAGDSGLLMIGGGSPKNFAQDTVVCAEILGKTVPMHKYSVQITVADVRDGACSSSSLKEASSWGKVDAAAEQMVFAEASLALPLLAAYGYHNGSWKRRPKRELARLLARD
ncbi:MAG TPA: deoxyhypusine synthase [Geminicoccaceae bacterium]|nr:deoxyhypusine synthase [Geminicoccaceae bacterium]